MSDYAKTLADFAKAKAGSLLPLEALDQRRRERAESRQRANQRQARRATLSHQAIGRLVFASTLGTDAPKPVPYMRVELWDRDFGSADDYLGAAETDADGRFLIAYDPADAGFADRPDLELRVVDHYNGEAQLLFVVEGDDDVREQVFDFGDVGLPYYEYHPEIPLPHVLTFHYGAQKYDSMPQTYRVGRKMALAKVASAVLGTRLRHYAHAKPASLAELQADYQGKTGYLPPAGLGPEASDDERFVYKLLNGAVPTDFTVDADGRYHVVRTWDAYAMDGEHELPNVDGVFELVDGRLRPISITVQPRVPPGTAPFSPLAEPTTTRPGEPGWDAAKHAFECANYMFGQCANHLARGHFNVEQYALAAWRNLRRSPLRALLFPHLQEVMIINVEGERAIFGPEGLITKNGALTEVSLVQAIMDQVDTDWWGWRPRAPLGPDHHYAHVANLYWDILGEHVDRYFAAHLEDILRCWGEARALSEDLVGHSVAYRPIPIPDGHTRLDPGEYAKPEAPRIEVDGRLRTVTPVVTSDEPSEAEVAALASMCRYAIYHATLWHSWVNDTTDALEPSYAQYNPTHRSTAKELTDHISVNLALSQTRYGMILRNEDGDIPPSLIELLEAKAGEFARYAYDPRRIRSRINI